MSDFVVGQRFLSDAEPELGLGIVTEVEFRTISLVFPATQDTRRYAHANAPLTRISFDVGDVLRDGAGEEAWVVAVQEHKGLLTYRVKGKATGDTAERQLSEVELSPQLSLSQPLKRLLAGRMESSAWFQLRRAALAAQGFIESSALLGLCSGRTELLPHQLYIAHEVSKRPSPRVLLCDEVGLGKTIEACLILQQQLFTGLASRVLILLPDSLVHQWLVELLRRFNLRFTILDEERCQALTEVNPVNPFESEQLVLCSREFLCSDSQWREQALQAGWDLLIVDEAHHLLNKHSATGALSLHDLVRQFAQQVPGLLLLTATPDQAGLESHFALLALLDPQRFHDLNEFIAEQSRYRELATQLETLAQDDEQQLNDLLDRHGTGRVVFRNTRKTVSGFPERALHAYPLPLPDIYTGMATALQPEQSVLHDESWLRQDPRVGCVFELTQKLAGQKLLVICHRRSTAVALESHLRLQRGLRTAVFHEGLTLIERDRAAAYFADSDSGAQVLVCSEIGSEGRNFQFCHHLVLFDLPKNPDLLEQRIGRLDRIGQQHEVNIHVPYFRESAQAILLHLHAHILAITEQPNPVAAQVCNELGQDIDKLLQSPRDAAAAEGLFQQADRLNTSLLEQHAAGRDKLLELNSCRPQASADLLQQINVLEHEGTPRQFLRSVFASYGLDNEENSNGTWSVTPGADMLVSSFPCIPDDGMTFTLHRSLALKRDDLPFVNWLHPLLLQSLDMVLQDNNGKASVGVLRDKRLPAGTLVLESLFRVTVSGPARLQTKRWFPTTTLRAVVDSQKRSIGKALTAELLDKQTESLSKGQLRTLLQDRKETIGLLARLGKKVAEKQLPELIAERTVAMQQALTAEISRLEALRAVNPQVPDSEIDYFRRQLSELLDHFAKAQVHTEALRLFVVL